MTSRIASGTISSMDHGIARGIKVRENRLRRMAERQGFALHKSRRRDPLAAEFGTWYVIELLPGSDDPAIVWPNFPRVRGKSVHLSDLDLPRAEIDDAQRRSGFPAGASLDEAEAFLASPGRPDDLRRLQEKQGRVWWPTSRTERTNATHSEGKAMDQRKVVDALSVRLGTLEAEGRSIERELLELRTDADFEVLGRRMTEVAASLQGIRADLELLEASVAPAAPPHSIPVGENR